jgi:hypothetical protein
MIIQLSSEILDTNRVRMVRATQLCRYVTVAFANMTLICFQMGFLPMQISEYRNYQRCIDIVHPIRRSCRFVLIHTRSTQKLV